MARGAGPASTTVTSVPAAAATPATSAPIHPAPTTTSRRPGPTAARRAAASAAVCRVSAASQPAGRTGPAPVASTAASAVCTARGGADRDPVRVVAQPGRRLGEPHVGAGQVHVQLVAQPGGLRTGQQLLGQRGPVVGLDALGAQQRHPTGEARGAQRLHRAGAGQPGAHHHDGADPRAALRAGRPVGRHVATVVCGAVSTRAVWVVPTAVLAVPLVALLAGAQVASLLLALELVMVAGARWVWRRERPEALAVRAWPLDVAVSLALAVGIVVLAFGPGL